MSKTMKISGAICFLCPVMFIVLAKVMRMEYALAFLVPILIVSAVVSVAEWTVYMLDVKRHP